MKFDVFKWAEIEAGEVHEICQGRVHVMCSKESAVYVEVEGYEVLAGVGTEVRADIQADVVRVKIDAPKGTRAFIYKPMGVSMKSEGEIFTNADRKPLESGTVLEVKKALREFKLEQMRLRQAMRGEREALEQMRKRQRLPEGEAEPKDEPEAAVHEAEGQADENPSAS